ncbi:MAG TPA: 7-carboxy-7-deazaguanine synthase, partial [Syntrophales bacterium]|nr:7-carboxy-7-deazaguanine synthase [Syntrophales bacterium]
TEKDEIKFVVGDRADYEYACKVLPLIRERCPGSTVLFSPLSGRMEPRRLAGWILEDRLFVRLQLQLHRVLWPEKNRGV